MKKIALTIAILLGLGFGAFAQGGLFQYGAVSDEEYYGTAFYSNRSTTLFSMTDLNLPQHGSDINEPAPLAGGALLLIGFGAAYAATKRRKK